MGSPPTTPFLLHEHEDHSYDMVYMDAYLGAQIEVLDDSVLPVDFAMVSDNLELPSSFIDVQFERNVHYFGLDNDVPVPSMNKLELEQVKDCFMGTEEETGQITPTVNVDPTFRDIVNSGDFGGQMIPLEAAEELNSSKQLLKKNEKVYRQRRFKKGWEEMKNKVVAMNNRIGTKTSIHAVFENVIYFMDISKGTRTTDDNKKTDLGLPDDNDSDSENSRAPSEASVVEGDHRYAAVILTQKESSSSIRDHQYNQESLSSSGFESSGSLNTQASSSTYIKSRYKRERQLVRYINALFMKKQTLEGTTGAKIYLEISYEHYIFNSSNWKSAEETLSDNRKKIFRVPVVSTVDLSNSNSISPSPTDIFANFNPNNPQIFMRVERVPAVGDITPGIHVQYIKRKNKDNTATTAPPPTTFDMPLTVAITNTDAMNQECTLALSQSNLTTSSSSLLSPEYLNLDHPYGLSPFNQDDSGESSPQLVYNPPVQEETIEHHDSDFDSVLLMHDQPLNLNSLKNAATITEPVCGLCGLIGIEDCSKELWLRCFNSLCHYMAHVECVGFRVSATQLAMLPPYLCPSHR